MSYLVSIDAALEMKSYAEDYVSHATEEEKSLIKEDLKEHGIIHSIVITKVSGEYRIVKGKTRMDLVKELYGKKEWTHGDEIRVKEIPEKEALTRFISESLARKEYTKMQRAMFGAKHLWDSAEVPKESTTQEKVAKLVGSNHTYVQTAKTLLNADAEAYKLVFTLGAPFTNNDLRDLTKRITDKNETGLVKKLIAAYEEDSKKFSYRKIVYPNQIANTLRLDDKEIKPKKAVNPVSMNKKTLTIYTDAELDPSVKLRIEEALQDDFTITFKTRDEETE